MIGWRMHLGVIFPTSIPARVVREFYEVVPEGVDLTMVTNTIRQLSREDLEQALDGIERAAEQLALFEVDFIYLLGVPPLTIKGPGYDRKVIARIEKASGLPASTDITGVMQAFRKLSLKKLVMATPFEEEVNQRIKDFLNPEGFDIVHMKGLQIRRHVEIHKLPIPVEYRFAREVFQESPVEPDGIYIPCGGWGSIHNIQRLENDLKKPVVTWLQAMIWTALEHKGVRDPIHGYGKLIETL